MILHSEDYQFQQTVPFVRIDEYHNEQKGKSRLQGKRRMLDSMQYRQSLLRFGEEGQLLSCSLQSGDDWQEEVQYFYENELLLKRIFTLQGTTALQREENCIYNEKKLLKEKNILEGNHLYQRIFYKYNEYFQLIREENLQNTKLFFYNDAGLLAEEHIYTGDEHVKTLQYRYDDSANIIELWEESPVGKISRLHKYDYNKQDLLAGYQLVNQDGLILSNLEYRYNNFIDQDWLERYTWRLSGRAGKASYHPIHSCLRSPTIERSNGEDFSEYLRFDYKVLELAEGQYRGQTRLGMMHGQGRLDFFDASYYIGHFDSGYMEGYGSFYWPDGRLYQGYFRNNQMEGWGSYYLADGSLYQGTFSAGQLLSSRPYYCLAGDSPLSHKNRLARQAKQKVASGKTVLSGTSQSTLSSQDRLSDQEFIEAATTAVQKYMQEQILHAEAAAEIAEEGEAEEREAAKEVELQRVLAGRIADFKAESSMESEVLQKNAKATSELPAIAGLLSEAGLTAEGRKSFASSPATEGVFDIVPPPSEIFQYLMGSFDKDGQGNLGEVASAERNGTVGRTLGQTEQDLEQELQVYLSEEVKKREAGPLANSQTLTSGLKEETTAGLEFLWDGVTELMGQERQHSSSESGTSG